MDKELFRFIRISKRMTQREFAKKLGVSHALVAEIERGNRRITTRTRNKVMHSFGFSKSDISHYTEFLQKVM